MPYRPTGQSLPNCRGWASYEIAPPVGGPQVTLSAALPAWVAATTADWPAAAVAAAAAAERATEEVAAWREGGAAAAGPWSTTAHAPYGPGQDIDALTYPMNPSCYYPPG